MADNAVLRLVVDDKEYNNSLRQARQGLQALEKSLKDAGKSFSDVDKHVVEYVRATGQMETTAKTSRGALRDMTQTLTDLTLQYRALSDEEKKSPFGEALSQSLAELTERASDINDAMGDVAQSISNAASDTRAFDQIAGGVTFLTSGLQTAQGAAKLLGIEFGKDIEIIAKLQAAMAVTSGLQQIQAMLQKQSALMQGIIALQTRFNFLAKMNPYALLATGAAVLVTSLVALTSKEDEQVRKMEEARKAAEDLKAEWDKIFNNTAGALYGKFITLQASWEKLQTIGEKTQWIKNNTSAFNELGVSIKSISNAEDVFVNNTDKMIKSIELRARAAVLQKQIEKSLEGGIKDENGLYTIGYAVSQNLAKELAEIQSELQGLMGTVSGGGGGGGGRGGGGIVANVIGSVADLNQQISELRKAQSQSVNVSEWDDWQVQIDELTDKVRILKGEIAGSFDENGNVAISLAKVKGIGIGQTTGGLSKQNLNVKAVNTEKKEDKTLQRINQMVGSVSSIASSLNQLGIEIPKGMSDMLSGIQAVITILEAIQTIEMVGSILGIFAGGGVVKAAKGYRVPGSSYSGDRVPILANSGEMVLNQFQQQALAANLQANNNGRVDVQPWVDSERIWLGMSNQLKRKGEGEIVTTGMLRRMGIM